MNNYNTEQFEVHMNSSDTVTSKGLTTVHMATRAHTGPPKPEEAFPAKEVLGAAEATEHKKSTRSEKTKRDDNLLQK